LGYAGALEGLQALTNRVFTHVCDECNLVVRNILAFQKQYQCSASHNRVGVQMQFMELVYFRIRDIDFQHKRTFHIMKMA